ncbi:TlpA family protein disulfide reductase [Bizionia argentinensis JUB59]|uniref:TlpA family protein disulfide reductase n=1 Tax=Bizionia argentinensis JUB59 TaxID=1046627 RepID=G2EHQ6_9FLAO|nr:TlpA disulfide reductase family protein [Bizionia argentinensis]EGV42040.1 TlpA family protein disulfide reductase [Bizionia argentinensis JUB59]
MKKTLILLSALSVLACQEEAPKDYATFAGKITNKNSDSLVVRTREYSKTIAVKDDGTFSDTLKVNTEVYNVFDGTESTNIFLKNGFDINMTVDTKEFDETVTYKGNGSEHSNFLAKRALKEEQLLNLGELSKISETEALEIKFNGIKTELDEFYNSDKAIDSTIIENANKDLEPMLMSYKSYLGQSIALKKELPKGMASPIFKDFENIDGSTTSLSDLKGKYVYIDVWATWCGPCIAEIPSLKELEKEYHDKNIHFVSLSVDDGRGYKADSREEAAALSKEGWKKMIAEKDLGGIQIIAADGFQSEFIQNYKINGIPRFILIDPDGNIVSPDAPRPSSDAIKELLTELNI